MKKIFSKPKSLTDMYTHYCAGCGHGIVHKLIAEVIDELGVRERTIAVAPVGCAVIAYYYWRFDACEAPHGRTPCVAAGIKRVRPESIVFSYQGDGDLCAIGTAEIIHTANRGENITVIFVNNGIYGMTGGQMSPATLLEMKTATTPKGRELCRDGYPFKISEMLGMIPGVKYIERTAVNTPANTMKTKKAIKKGFENQIRGRGFSLIEVLSPCPTYWGMSAFEAMQWIGKDMSQYFPLGVIKA